MTTMTSTNLQPVIVRIGDGPRKWSPALPQWVQDSIRGLLEDVMVTDRPTGEAEATAAEWKAVYDQLSYMLDPDYDGGWELVYSNDGENV